MHKIKRFDRMVAILLSILMVILMVPTALFAESGQEKSPNQDLPFSARIESMGGHEYVLEKTEYTKYYEPMDENVVLYRCKVPVGTKQVRLKLNDEMDFYTNSGNGIDKDKPYTLTTGKENYIFLMGEVDYGIYFEEDPTMTPETPTAPEKPDTPAETPRIPVEKMDVKVPSSAVIDQWSYYYGAYMGISPVVKIEPKDATNKNVKWEVLTPEVAGYNPSAGIVPKRAGKAELKVTSVDNPKLSQTIKIELSYKTPLKQVESKKDNYTVKAYESKPLSLSFTPSDATEQRFDWSYSEEGIVQVDEAIEKDANGDKMVTHELLGLKPGEVKVTGTPIDSTGGANKVSFTVEVQKNDAPSKVTGVEASIRHGRENLNLKGLFNYGNEWTIFTLARSGSQFTEAEKNQYIHSANEKITSRIQAGRELKALDYSKIILALTALGKDPETATDYNLIEKIYNDKSLLNADEVTSNFVISSLLALDSHDYAIPESAVNTREKMIAQILKYQRDNGGFNLVIDGSDEDNMIDMTAKALQALAKYKDRPEVSAAIDKAQDYLRKNMKSDCSFYNEGGKNSCTQAEVIIALTALGIDPVDPENGYVRNGNNLVTRLQKFKADGGYVLIEDGRAADPTSTYSATNAFESYRRFENKENSLFDLTDVSLNSEKKDGQSDNQFDGNKTEHRDSAAAENNRTNSPKTGDRENLYLWIALMAGAAAVFPSVRRKIREK